MIENGRQKGVKVSESHGFSYILFLSISRLLGFPR